MSTHRTSGARQLFPPAFLSGVAGFLALVWAVYFTVGRLMVRRIYDGTVSGPAAQLFRNRGVHPLGYYYAKTQIYLFLLSVIFALAAAYLFLLISRRDAVKLSFLQERVRLRRRLTLVLTFSAARTLPVAAICLSVGGVFWLIYGYLGMLFQRSAAFSAENLMFQLDVPQRIQAIAGWPPEFHRLYVHPLFALLAHPWGAILALALGSASRAAVVLTAGCGAIAVALAFLVFRRILANRLDALLAALVFGLSFSQMFFGAVPDTQSWAVCSLAATYLAFLHAARSRRVNLSLWVALGVFSFGVTVTNLAQTAICLAFALSIEAGENRLARGLIWISAVLLLSLILALLQKAIYPSAELFISLKLLGEQGFASGFLLQQPLAALKQVIRQLFVFNVVGPVPDVLFHSGSLWPTATYSTAWYFGAPGMSALILWLAAMAGGLAVDAQALVSKKSRGGAQEFHTRARAPVSAPVPVIAGLSLCLGFNFLLHCFYGISADGRAELFTYSGNVTLLLLMLVFLGLSEHRSALRLLCCALIALAGYNNFMVIAALAGIYR